ncbi:hypothetical protein HL653_13675 [Sphingomonas sp. AP4-R1]|uniref:hypothetical protein n=1 Tax=Sphingomonas sp. AP4-R1 TaxID=2735134 RepID=UPI001493C60B|nr:hypothetical protein [Sphingomonas sp. AP4-R1]QJU58675.1 hypothetical protein HL653_13675 [Sphingomonas sp. AP4-R1]
MSMLPAHPPQPFASSEGLSLSRTAVEKVLDGRISASSMLLEPNGVEESAR